MPVGNPVCPDGSPCGEQLFDDDIAVYGGAFMATIILGPGHADPCAGAELAAEVRVESKPALGAINRRQ